MLLLSSSMSKRQIPRTRLHSGTAGFSLMELMVTLAVAGTIAAIALPQVSRAIAFERLNGSIRSLSNTAALAKTRAGAQFQRERLFLDRGANTYHLETCVPVVGAVPPRCNWTVDGVTTPLPVNVTFNFAPVGAPPPNTQPGINHAPACLDNQIIRTAIPNTSCIVFNSRGIPIVDDPAPALNGGPTNADAVYITDGTAVLAVTVTTTGLIGVWNTQPVVVPLWKIA